MRSSSGRIRFLVSGLLLALVGTALAVGWPRRSTAWQAATWNTQTSSTTKDLLSVHFINDCEGWAAGKISGLRHTTNCGVNWQTAEFPCSGFDYHSVRFLDQATGWIGGTDLAARTTNGGANWTCMSLSTAFVDRNSLFPVSTNLAWAVGREFAGPRNFFRYNFSGTPTEEIFQVAGSTEFFDVYCADADDCWAVGASGKIVHITNASGTPPVFTLQTSGTTQQLNDVHMQDLNTGWVVGNGGTILVTGNGGATWTAQTSGTPAALKGVHFRNGSEGWAVGAGGVILITSDGGANWAPETSGATTDLENVFFTPNTGYAVGLGGKILKRTAGSCTISVAPSSFSLPGAGSSNSLTITAPTGCGWNVADDAAWLTFSSATSGNGNGAVNFSVAANTSAARTATITVTGESNTISVPVNQDFDCSLNLAISPASQTQPIGGGTGAVSVTGLTQCNWTATPSDSWIHVTAGGSGAGNGTVSYSVDANVGAQRSGTIAIGSRIFTIYQVGTCAGPWCWQASGTSNFLNDVHFLNDNEGWASGPSATLRHTTDGGATWIGPPSSPSIFSTDGFNSVRFLDQNTGWAGGLYAVVRTGNGGTSWTTRSLSTSNFRNSYFPTSSAVIWAAGGGGGCRSHFRYTFTGSVINEEIWNVCAGPTMLDISCVDADNCWSVGASGTIVRIANASGTPAFAPQTSGTSQSLYGIQMLDLNTGWVVGLGGTILKTVDGGATWTPQTSGVTTRLNGVNFLNANDGWVAGTGGVILRTTNGGAAWSPESSGVPGELASVFFPSAGAGYAVGESGTILKRTSCPTVTLIPSAGALPAGAQGAPYNQIFTANGGLAPYSFTVIAGALPMSLSLSTGGVLNGTPSAPGIYNFTVKGTDQSGCTGLQAYTLTITTPPGCV